MIRRIAFFTLVIATFLLTDLAESEAARRRGGFFRRAQSNRMTYRSNNSAMRSPSRRPAKLHETHSRSAILNGFFGPSSGVQGHDRSWYVGK